VGFVQITGDFINAIDPEPTSDNCFDQDSGRMAGFGLDPHDRSQLGLFDLNQAKPTADGSSFQEGVCVAYEANMLKTVAAGAVALFVTASPMGYAQAPSSDGASPYVAIENEPPPKLIVDPTPPAAGEPGTLQFEILLPKDGDTKVLTYEVYRDDVAFEVHRNGPSLAQLREETSELVVKLHGKRCAVID